MNAVQASERRDDVETGFPAGATKGLGDGPSTSRRLRRELPSAAAAIPTQQARARAWRVVPVLVVGATDWKDERTVRVRLQKLPASSVVIVHVVVHVVDGDKEDEHRGAAQIAARVGRELGFAVHVAPDPDRLLDTAPVLVVAFHDFIQRSARTRAVVEEAQRRGIRVEVIRSWTSRRAG